MVVWTCEVKEETGPGPRGPLCRFGATPNNSWLKSTGTYLKLVGYLPTRRLPNSPTSDGRWQLPLVYARIPLAPLQSVQLPLAAVAARAPVLPWKSERRPEEVHLIWHFARQ